MSDASSDQLAIRDLVARYSDAVNPHEPSPVGGGGSGERIRQARPALEQKSGEPLEPGVARMGRQVFAAHGPRVGRIVEVSREGSGLLISDESKKRFVVITDKQGDNKITVKADDKEIEILSNGDINIKGAKGKITVEAKDLELKSSTNIKISASQKLEITAGTDLALKGSMNTSVEGGIKMEVKGTQTSVQGTAMTEIKAPMVKIN